MEYEAIDSILMPPGGDFPMDVDLVLHVGQGKKGMVCVEQYARSMPYTQLDNKDQVPQKGDGRRWGWPKDWETLKTHVPVYELVEFLSHDQKWPEVYPSKVSARMDGRRLRGWEGRGRSGVTGGCRGSTHMIPLIHDTLFYCMFWGGDPLG